MKIFLDIALYQLYLYSMFLREASVKRTSGQIVKYLYLLESQWQKEKKRPTHKLIYSFGRVDALNREKMLALAHNILSYLNTDADVLDEESEILYSKPMGTSHLVRGILEKLGIVPVLHRLLKRRRYESPVKEAIVGMILNRLVYPSSKWAANDWLKEKIFYPPASYLKPHHYYRALDFLEESKDGVEEELFWQTRDLLNRQVDLVFYDTTSTYVEGEGEAELLQYGYSRDHRPDKKQVVVGLATDHEGLPLVSSAFPGNTMDMKTVKGMMARLEPLQLGRVIFVCDRGMVSEENLKLLSKHHYDYLVGMKLRGNLEVRDKVLSRRGRYQKASKNLEVKEVLLDGKRYIVCHNPKEEERDEAYRQELLSRLQEEIEAVNRGKGKATSLLGHPGKKRFVKELSSGRLKLSRQAIREESRYDGKYVLLTTERKLDPASLAKQYKNLASIEQAFRSLKHRVRIRPIYHRTDPRIKAHISLCVLSYFIARYAELKTERSWPKVQSELDQIAAVKILLKNGTVIKRSQMTKRQKLVYSQLDIEAPPLILGQ